MHKKITNNFLKRKWLPLVSFFCQLLILSNIYKKFKANVCDVVESAESIAELISARQKWYYSEENGDFERRHF